jgi:lipopolysaccharide assembly protein A
MAIVYLILALLIAVVAVVFALQNTTTITIAFFAWKMTGSLSLVFLVTLLIGILIGWLFVAPSLVKHSLRASGQRKRLGALEKELEDHKVKLSELQKPAPIAPKPVDSPAPVASSKPTDTDPLQHS